MYIHMYIMEEFILCVITGIASITVLLPRKRKNLSTNYKV